MKRTAVIFLAIILIPFAVFSEELPDWVYKQSQRQGDTWLFSGSVHDVSLMNVGVPLARAAALSNMASTIGVLVNAEVGQRIEGSEMDGYTETVIVSHGYEIDRVAAYGVETREMHVERVRDDYSGRDKFNVHILISVPDAELQKAKADFARRAVVRKSKPVMRSKDDDGFLSRLVRRVGL